MRKTLLLAFTLFSMISLFAVNAFADFLAGEVTDTGGIDDRSFNASAWKGLMDAQKEDRKSTRLNSSHVEDES
jgi:basic membrane protein A and related proteins